MRLDPPFVLLDDARPGGTARLYRAPHAIVRADTVAEMPAAFAALRRLRAEGRALAGFLTYEAAAGIEPRTATHPPAGPCLWFGAFDRVESVDTAALLPGAAGAWAGGPRPRITRRQYGERFARVAELIAAGDIYQANLSFRADVPVAGDPAALYALLRGRAGAGYGALVATGAQWLLSFSPELFFSLEGDRLAARPMKGTARRGATPQEDAALADALAGDAKQRAENLMIVDLMRNDLSRVARPGSVRVPSLFEVERYPTVHQMVSGITATLGGDADAIDVLSALFPCGSITGAPKLRAMEVIKGVEDDARGIYTGAIGHIDADGDAMFNVAIRTLTLDPGSPRAVLGLGSGLVADSQADEEWEECLAKGAFVTAGEQGFDLIETMRFDPEEGILMLERHLERLKDSAAALGFAFDRHEARNELQAATFRLRDAARVRLVLAPSGVTAIGVAPLPALPPAPVAVAVVPLPVDARDFRLRHKTSRRGFYDRARLQAGSWEVLFSDDEEYLTEGSFTSLFVPRGDVLVTPPLARGLLPGVLRAELLASGRAIEGELRPHDLARGFFVGNALRGLVAAVTVAKPADAAL